ncbi:RLA class II histocompatibility antigen, DP alpha-1 chain-like [Parambassis ranga]|uniref:RLA class II histocompatibility antigen, DP alpha-1 chain-like n=1 Tax=Parambassis ranga TaxID=210632 RepID=A0A6P7JU31_9TELE|nr:RLA class II histocompatibility antigen, DP alpha-1 chain-like [Parambassis ranga]
MERSVTVILVLNTVCVFSQIPHDLSYLLGCFVNGTAVVQFDFDSSEVLYFDFQRNEVIYTVPLSIEPDPSKILVGMNIPRDALDNREICLALVVVARDEETDQPEEQDPPDSILYPVEEVEPGVQNSLVCFVNHFYPPSIKVSWTKNGLPVSEGVSLSRYHPNNDQTFHQFSTLTFTPSEGDIYSCTVEHEALEGPLTRIWEAEAIKSDQSFGLDVFCGGGLCFGLFGFVTGVFLFVRGNHEQ